MLRHCLFYALIFIYSRNAFVNCSRKYAEKLLLISMDGFRWDYLEKAGPGNTPNFDTIAARGVKLPYMINAFITKTFPNHYTIATGLYEESHGIIGNKMYDPDHNATFSMASHESFWWDEGEPIWVTARKQHLKTATYYWPGSEVVIRGYRPDIWLPYSDTTPFQQRIDTVMDWFTNQGVDMATLYFPEPDKTGHLFGPDSHQIIEKVLEMDGFLGKIIEGIKTNNLEDKLNVILLSDHGMTTIDMYNRLIDIIDFVDTSQLAGVYDKGPIANIRPRTGHIDDVYNTLRNAHPNMTVYLKQNIPEYFHYKNNRRVQPVFVMADEGWYIVNNKSRIDHDDMAEKGAHGYDNRLVSMRPIFFAFGPNFKKNFRGQPIRNVDVYPLMCELLQIKPSPNNGTLASTSGFVVPFSDSGTIVG